MHYDGVKSYLFVNSAEIYTFKAQDSHVKTALLSLGNVSKDFSADNMKKTGLYEHVYDFSVDYDSIDAANTLDIHEYFMKKHDIKCFSLLKIFIDLLSVSSRGRFSRSLVSNSQEPMKCISFTTQPCQGTPTIVNINSDATLFYSFIVTFQKCGRSCNTIDYPYARVCIKNKVKNMNVKLFNLMLGVNKIFSST